MANNLNLLHQPQAQACIPGHWAGYMLGGWHTPPPPRPRNYTVTMMNSIMDHVLDGGQICQEEEDDENIDPQLRVQTQIQARPPSPAGELLYYWTPTYFLCSVVAQIVVQVPVGNNVVDKIKFPLDILQNDFLDHIYAAMSLDRQKDEVGWKTCDEADHAANHRLSSFSDVDDAIRTTLDIQNNPRRRKPVFLKVTHLVWLTLYVVLVVI